MVFTFAGSTHTKYATYLLEMISSLELESTPELRHAILSNLVVNLTGKAGSFQAGDLMQEYFNRLLEAVVDRKGMDYGDRFIRNIISPNLHHFARILNDLKDGVGLQHRSGRHSAPHEKPELRTLAHIYRDAELHLRRPGRVPTDPPRDVDQFYIGYEKLQNGKLKKWVRESIFMRSVRIPPPSSGSHACSEATNTGADQEPITFGHEAVADTEGMDIDDEFESDAESGGSNVEEAEYVGGIGRERQPLAVARMFDGELIVEEIDFQELAAELLDVAGEGGEGESEDNEASGV